MDGKKIWLTGTLLSALVSLCSAASARADLAACGHIFVSGDADCEWRKTEECMTQCKSETVETACAAKLYTSCESQCTESATTTCQSGCSQSCTTSCTEEVTQEEPPNCMGLCVADCQKTCDKARGPRTACCNHTCKKRCDDKCKNQPEPVKKPAVCTETCTNACSGSCTAQANVTCQQNCQTEVYEECETETIETCETKCMEEGGAIFCDGQFVNAPSARSCADELKAKLDIDVNIDVRGEITAAAEDVADGTKDAVRTTKKKANALCSVGPVGARQDTGLGGLGSLLLSAGMLLLCARRRR